MGVTPATHGPAGPQPSAPHVNAVSIDFALEGITLESSIACDWKAFDETALAISSLRIVVLGFHSHEDLSRFGAEVVDVHFERLRTAGKLRFAIWDSKDERWKRASRDSDATEGVSPCADRYARLKIDTMMVSDSQPRTSTNNYCS
ncbi:hypothetical protein PHLCEN_2v9140 [Hermanssonia centrifuga]|uniref:Uncharacterized protein n=1 Tax=Hermanssonia centrifuga TaxID=98765 RepID=A0A2R6NRL5_9APHY|nr:hypothetical protein PHLCEN_2v9140 [Hermanssonia centrifuga]